MAQINITLDSKEILQLFSEDQSEGTRNLYQRIMNVVLKTESLEQLRAQRYERSDERTDSRNGFRERGLKTRVGTITLSVPRHRNQPFKTMLFGNYSRSEGALISTMAEMVVNGVSTRKVTKVIETLCGTSVSKSAVSEACKDFKEAVDEFRNRPLGGSYPFMTVDATYFKVRENQRVISKAMMIAYATNIFGHREIIGFNTYPRESKETWEDFLMSLKKRGLHGILMVTSDAHEGIRYALNKVFPDVPWQRCQFHFIKNISEKAPKKYQAGLRAELYEMFTCRTLEECRQKRNEILDDYKDVAEAAMKCLDEGFESAITVMLLPSGIRRFYRTSNHIERLNRELKRRSNVIGIFPNEDSLLRLIGSVLMNQHEQDQLRRAHFSEITYQQMLLSNVRSELRKIAEEQASLLLA